MAEYNKEQAKKNIETALSNVSITDCRTLVRPYLRGSGNGGVS